MKDERRTFENLLSFFSPALLLVLWEAAVRLELLDARFFPAPTAVLGTFGQLVASGQLASDLKASLFRILAGYLLGGLAGLILGLTMGLFRLVRLALGPIVAATYPIPKIAILPLILLIFGLGESSKVVIIAIAVFYLVLLNTVAGVVNIDKIYLDVAKNFGAGRLQVYWTIAVPGALPLIITGFKLGLGVAFLVILAAEFVGARSGIGYLIWNSWQMFSVESMFVGIIVIALLGYLSSVGLDILERKLIPWK